MARMIPDCDLANISQLIPDSRPGAQGERFVYEYMKRNLPADWTVVYNFNCRSENGQNAQLDFLVIVPGKGIVNVDAKGAGYTVFPGGRVALNPGDKDVFEEACRGIHVVDHYLRSVFCVPEKEYWGAFGYLVAFTSTDFPSKLIGGNPYLQASELKNPKAMEDKILSILDNYSWSFRDFVGYGKAILDHFTQAREAVNVSVPSVPANPYDVMEAYSIKGLDFEQRIVANGIRTGRYAHVIGGAGTGKTIIALTCAKEFASEGCRVLYVCFNKALAARLGTIAKEFNLGDNASNLKICNFHSLGQKVFNRDLTVTDGNGFNRALTDQNIARTIPLLLRQQHLRHFNVLLVDEAQDLSSDNIRSLLPLLARENRRVAIFSDAGQTIFSLDWTLDEEMFMQPVTSFKLDRNYRNTDKIFKHFQPLSGEDTKPVIVSGPDFITKDVKSCAPDDIPSLIEKMLAEGVPPSQIAILSSTRDSLAAFTRVHNRATGHPISFTDNIEDWYAGKKLLKTRIQAFKGLEAACIFLIMEDQAGLSDDEWSRLRYVGESRAKYELYIVSTSKS